MKVPEVPLDNPCSFLTLQFPWTQAQRRRDDLCCLAMTARTARERKPKSFVQSLCVRLSKHQLSHPAGRYPGCKGDEVNLRCFRANPLYFIRGIIQQHRPFPGRGKRVLLGGKLHLVANFLLYKVTVCLDIWGRALHKSILGPQKGILRHKDTVGASMN